jgi:hypothetical protein
MSRGISIWGSHDGSRGVVVGKWSFRGYEWWGFDCE